MQRFYPIKLSLKGWKEGKNSSPSAHSNRKQEECCCFFYLLFNPSLQLVHFFVELLQVLDSTQGPRLIRSRLFQGLPLVPELAELLLHEIRGGVQLADQLLAHLFTPKETQSQRSTDSVARLTSGLSEPLLSCSSRPHNCWKTAINFLDLEKSGSASAPPGLSECQGRLIISIVPFPTLFSWGRKYKLAWQSCLEHWGSAFLSGWLELPTTPLCYVLCDLTDSLSTKDSD